MRVSQKADYALRAMIDLALSAGGSPLTNSEIARRSRIPEKFLEAILVDLRKAGLVQSRRGPDGGHLLARAAGQVSLAQIRAAVDGPLSIVERNKRSDTREAGLRAVWEEVERGIARVLEEQTLDEMCRRVDSARRAPDFSI